MNEPTVTTKTPESTPTTGEVHRESYGTAKTEDLRDSGIWRILLPTFIILSCIAVGVIPLAFLVPLLINSLVGQHTLTWLWITMIVIELGIASIAIVGFMRIFLTQAGNYK